MDAALQHLVQEALLTVLAASAPALLAALATGLVVGVLQAATSVQEPTVAVVPRLVAVAAALALAGPFAAARLVRLAQTAFDLLPRIAP
ncbi:MAG: flagellar biosynthetic protein FliQ [Anaeromyxobacteraceae bacterium]